MNIDLTGKRALVTGATTGIGRAIATACGEAGAAVAINYPSDDQHANAEEIARTIRDHGHQGLTVQADVSDPAQVARMFAALDRDLGGIDLLVNNAGIEGDKAPGWKLAPEEWRKPIEVNLLGGFNCAHEALKRMVEQKSGVIINITSVHEAIPRACASAYTASKAGLSMLTKTLAQEAAGHGVRVVALAPGAIKTPINRDVREDPQGHETLMGRIPMKRIGEPQEIAALAVMLASSAASYVTGTTLFADGGMTDYPSFEEG